MHTPSDQRNGMDYYLTQSKYMTDHDADPEAAVNLDFWHYAASILDHRQASWAHVAPKSTQSKDFALV